MMRPLGAGGINFAAIELLALFCIAKQVIGAGYFLELLFGFRIAWIEVGMQFLCKFPVGFLKLGRRRRMRHPDDVIWIFHRRLHYLDCFPGRAAKPQLATGGCRQMH